MEFHAIDRRLEGSTLLRQCQLTELYLLDIFVELCERHNLRYFLNYGTLLGAVRHHGFIPWDDDIDVSMPYDDYKKFFKIAPQELPGNTLLTPSKEWGYHHKFGKLRDRSSFFCESNTRVDWPCGIYIDIFPIKQIANFKPSTIKKICDWFANIDATIMMYDNRVNAPLPRRMYEYLKSIIWKIIRFALTTYIDIKTAFSRDKIWHIPLDMLYWLKYPGFNDTELFPLKKCHFEDADYYIPADANAILRQYYGNWEIPLPENRRIWHHSIVCPTQAPNVPWAVKFIEPNTAKSLADDS